MPDDNPDQQGWLLKQMDQLEKESRDWPERMKQALREKQEYGVDGLKHAPSNRPPRVR